MKNYYLLVCAAVLVAFTSCNSLRIEKRQYRDGFYISYNNKTTPTDHATPADPEAPAIAPSDQPETVAAEPLPSMEPVATPEEISEQSVEQNAHPEAPSVPGPIAGEPNNSMPEQAVDVPRALITAANQSDDADLMLVLLIILAIILPPLAVFLKEGATTMFWIDLILALLGSGFFYRGYFAGFFLAAIIVALLVVFDVL